MSLEEWMTAALGALLVILIVIRLILTMRPKSVSPARYGASMTIGEREVQEDNTAVLETASGLLAVLGDGMGKAYGGKAASRIAVETFIDLFRDYNAFDNPQYYFRKAFGAANRAILTQIDEGRGSACVAAALIREKTLYYAVVGNPKVAVFRGGDLIPVSEGHTIDVLARHRYQEGRLTRQDAVTLLEHHRLYNFVGQDGFRDVELFDKPLTLRAGDIVALMSDGVFECLPWKEIEEVLSEGSDTQAQAYEIIERVNRSKKEQKDNASILLVRA